MRIIASASSPRSGRRIRVLGARVRFQARTVTTQTDSLAL
jgi:hypothetical protein